MKILMIGDSSVGKTTFMTSTYGLMHDGDIGGFRVQCGNKQADKKLIDAYRNFRATGKYPPATVRMSSYDYDFYCGQDWVMNFTLTDIRGESIHDYNVDDLHQKIKEADAIMLFLSAYDIVNGVDIEDSIDDLYMLLNNGFYVEDRERLLMVVLSQVDRLEAFDGDTLNRMLEPISELKEMADRNDNIVYQVVPTACSLDCMMDLDFAMVTLMLVGYAVDVQKRREDIETEIESIQAQYGSGLLRTIKHMFGLDSERIKALKRMQSLQAEIPKFESMIEKFNKLQKFYDDYEIGTYYTIKKRWSSTQENLFEL